MSGNTIPSDASDIAALLARWDAQLPFGSRHLTTRDEVLDFTRKMDVLGWELAQTQYAEALMLLRAVGCVFSIRHDPTEEEYAGWGKRIYDFVPRGSTALVQRLLVAPTLPMECLVRMLRAGKRSKALQRELALRSLAR